MVGPAGLQTCFAGSRGGGVGPRGRLGGHRPERRPSRKAAAPASVRGTMEEAQEGRRRSTPRRWSPASGCTALSAAAAASTDSTGTTAPEATGQRYLLRLQRGQVCRSGSGVPGGVHAPLLHLRRQAHGLPRARVQGAGRWRGPAQREGPRQAREGRRSVTRRRRGLVGSGAAGRASSERHSTGGGVRTSRRPRSCRHCRH